MDQPFGFIGIGMLDIWMADIHWVALRVRQFKDDRIANIPVIVHSLAPPPKPLADFLQARAYLTKPAEADVLLDTVTRVISQQ